MSGRGRTLAGRMAAVQTAVTLIALVAVAIMTAVTMSLVLRRRSDRLLTDVAARVAAAMERLPETTEPYWIAYEAEEQRPAGARIEVRSAGGTLLAGIGEKFDLPSALAGCADRGPVRVCGMRSAHFAVVAASPRASDDAARRDLAVVLLAVVLAAAALVAALGRRVARMALTPVSELAARIAVLEPGDPRRPGERSGLAEIDILRSRFDELLTRFEEALDRERRLAAQASHELRTPLTVARAEIEALATPDADTGSVQRALAAVDRLSALVEALLWFAKAQSRLDDQAMEVVNLADVVRAEIAGRQRGAGAPPIVSTLPDEALVRGDERLLGRIAANLLDNAVKYGEGLSIRVRADRQASQVRVTVSNAGRLATDIRPRLFEPFVRGNGAAINTAGFGLGLPFARAVARAHGGDLAVDEGGSDTTTFVLTLPLVAWTECAPSGAAG